MHIRKHLYIQFIYLIQINATTKILLRRINMTEFANAPKLFNRWTFEGLEVDDISLTDYIAHKNAVYLPHTAARYAKKRFRKVQCPIIERLVCALMFHGRNSGKKLLAVRIVRATLELIHLMTDENPIQVVVSAVANAGPREDSTRVGSAGVVRRQSCDVSPFRLQLGIILDGYCMHHPSEMLKPFLNKLMKLLMHLKVPLTLLLLKRKMCLTRKANR